MFNWFQNRQNVVIVNDDPSTSISTRVSSRFNTAPEELFISVLGSYNRWSILVTLIYCIVMVYYGFNIYSVQLLAPKYLQFNCTDENNTEDKISSCYISNGSLCRTFEFSQIYGYTITEKWELVCEEQIKSTIISIVFTCGIAFGSVIFGYLADRWGRKKVFFFCIILQAVTGVSEYSTTSYPDFGVTRFLNGFALSGTTLIALIMTCELSANKWRTFHLGLLYLCIGVGHLTIPFIWTTLANYAKTILVLSLPQLIFLTLIRLMKESPNWLLGENRAGKAETVFMAAAKFNGTNLPSNFRIRPLQILNMNKRKIFRLLGIFQDTIRWMILALFLMWFLTAFITWITLEHIWLQNDNLLEIIPLTGISCISSTILFLLFCYICKHKFVIVLSSISACLTMCIPYYIVSQPSKKNNDFFLMYEMIAYGLFSTTFIAVWNMTPRLFPTEMRSQGTGVAIAIGQIGVMTAELLMPVVFSDRIVFFATFSICTLIILLCAMMVSSVHGRELPDTLDDTKNFKRIYKPTRWSTLRTASPTLDETEIKLVDFERGTSITAEDSIIPLKFKKKNSARKPYTELKANTSTSTSS